MDTKFLLEVLRQLQMDIFNAANNIKGYDNTTQYSEPHERAVEAQKQMIAHAIRKVGESFSITIAMVESRVLDLTTTNK